MRTLYVMYDAQCGLCTEARNWLRSQPSHIPLRLLPSDSEWIRQKFPGLPAGELAVVSDSGEVWLGDRAFIVCLWALRAYRRWARRLASPSMLPLARQAFAALSRNRKNLSALLRLKSEAELKDQLRKVAVPTCPIR